MVLLSVSQITKRYSDGRRKVAVLDGVSMEIDLGDFVGVWGPRRSGKSTLLRVLAGIEPPDGGSVCFDGKVMTAMSGRARARLLRSGGIALVKADWGSEPHHRAVEDVALALLPDGLSMREAKVVARRVMGTVGASDFADLKVDELTIGERMRVSLAKALVHEPRLVLVDEPAVLSSPRESEALYELLRSLGARRDLALLVASEDVMPLNGVQRMMTLSDGQLRGDEPGVVLPFPDQHSGAGSVGS